MSKASTSASELATAPIEGLWRSAGSGRAKAARLAVDASGVAVVLAEDGTPFARAAIGDLEISDRVGSIPRHLAFPLGGDFETADNDAVDRLVSARLGRRGFVHRLERVRALLTVLVAVTALLAFGIYRYAVPLLVEVAVAVTPPAATAFMSRSVMASLDSTVFDTTRLDQPRQDSLSAQFARISELTPKGAAAKAAGTALPYSLNFRAGGAIGPNAFALPDGTIVITDELVALARDDDMIMGVLAHEIGHVDHDHSLRQLYRIAGVTALIMLIGGDIGAATEDVLLQGAAVLSLSYSREAEREADRFSVELMHEAGRDPAAIARFFEIIRDQFGDRSEVDFMSTHPATPGRIEETRRYAREFAGHK